MTAKVHKVKKNIEEDRTENNSTANQIIAEYLQSKSAVEKENAAGNTDTNEEADNDDEFFKTLDIYESNIGRTTADEFMELSDVVGRFGSVTVIKAIYDAIRNNVKSMTGVKWYIDKNIENRCYS